ncbi:MAG: ABC transporter permease [Chloroflexi bacterium]|nr:ABC transporter permease [Chloroflexota bacterium]
MKPSRAKRILLIFILLAVVSPWLARYDPNALFGIQFEAPNWQHWLGTDQLGRDVYSRLVVGIHRSLILSGLATMLAAMGGFWLGIFASHPRYGFSRFLHAIINSLLALPGLLWSLVIITVLGSHANAIVIAVGTAQIAPFARVIYAKALSVYRDEYVLAARAQGASELYLIPAHILPNCLTVMSAYCAVIFSQSILNVAALTFLGLAGTPGVADLGVLLNEGRAAILQAPWIALSAGGTLTLLVMAINQLSEDLAAIP